MLPHNLVKVTIFIDGLPEYCGTDEALQELTEEAEALVESIAYTRLLQELLAVSYSELADKIEIDVQGP